MVRRGQASNRRLDGEDARTGRRFPRDLIEKAAQHQNLPASTPVGPVDQRRSRLVGMGDPETRDCAAFRYSTSRRDYTSHRSVLACTQRPYNVNVKYRVAQKLTYIFVRLMPNTHRRRRRDEIVLSRRRRRCVLGINLTKY